MAEGAKKYNKVIYGGKVLIDLTGDTVTPADLAKGVIAHDKSGAEITGTSTKDSDTSADLFPKTYFLSHVQVEPHPFSLLHLLPHQIHALFH